MLLFCFIADDVENNQLIINHIRYRPLAQFGEAIPTN